MLYRPQPRFTILAALRTVLARLGGLVAGLRQSRSDADYLDGASAHLLKDIGLNRVEDDRWRHFY